jgi:ATP-binding cassette, subfamily C (CFTR/MRP), member 1
VVNFNTGDFDGQLTYAGFQFIKYVIYYSLICIMVLISCFSDKPPKHTTYPKSPNPSPELKASMMNRAFFWYFDRIAWTGWRRPLTDKDIYDINPEDSSAEIIPRFEKLFKKDVEMKKRYKSM